MIDLLKQIDGVIPNFKWNQIYTRRFYGFSKLPELCRSQYDMLWGRDENMLSALVLGNKGAVEVPITTQHLYTLHLWRLMIRESLKS
jgi:N-acetylneuraminate lyase